MPITLAEADLQAVLDVADTARQVQPTEDSIQDLLTSVAGLVPCDQRFWNRTSLVPRRELFIEIGMPDGYPLRREADFTAEWERHRAEHPIMSGRDGTVVAVSDVYPATFGGTWLYNECFRPVGIRHEIGVHLSHPADEIHVVVLSRGPGRDFDERDRLVLRLLRPHLDAAFRRVGFARPRLTPREVDVLRLVREGLTNAQIARRLQVRETTVAKHLEHVYARTGARSRLQAVQACRDSLG